MQLRTENSGTDLVTQPLMSFWGEGAGARLKQIRGAEREDGEHFLARKKGKESDRTLRRREESCREEKRR